MAWCGQWCGHADDMVGQMLRMILRGYRMVRISMVMVMEREEEEDGGFESGELLLSCRCAAA